MESLTIVLTILVIPNVIFMQNSNIMLEGSSAGLKCGFHPVLAYSRDMACSLDIARAGVNIRLRERG
jgi:hypothetical protein